MVRNDEFNEKKIEDLKQSVSRIVHHNYAIYHLYAVNHVYAIKHKYVEFTTNMSLNILHSATPILKIKKCSCRAVFSENYCDYYYAT